MKQKMEDAIKRRKAIMVIMEIILVIGCIISIWIMSIPKDKFLASTYSYSKVEKYEINGNYITRVMPQTDYETFIKIAQNTLKDIVSEDFSIKVYKDKEKTQEVTSGYITTGMIVAINSENEEKKEDIVEQKDESANQVVSANTINANSNSEKQNVISEDEKAKNETNENVINETNAVTQNVVDSENVDVENKVDTSSSSEDSESREEVNKGLEYTINVVGDLTGNGDMSVTELTRIVRGVVKLKNWDFKEDEKTIVDLNGDNQIDITDVECCINYIVFGEFEVVKKDVASPSIEVTGEKDSINDYYTSDVEVKVIENEPKENIEKTTISVEMNFSDTGETKVVDTNEKTFKLSRNGTYTITSQTYNKDGNKSDIVTKTIRINKEQKTEVAYKVEHYKEKLDGSYELVETENLTGTTGTKVTAQAKEYIGFTEDTSNKDRIPEGTITGDGSLILRLYYTRNQYTVTLNKDENVESVTGAGTYKYGATASINATLKEELGYDIKWSKWVSGDSTLVADNETQNAKIEMPAGNITLTATTTKEAKTDTAYKVEYYKEKLDGSYELVETENKKGKTGDPVTAQAKEYIGFTEDTSNKDRIPEGTITGDGSLILRLYYTRNQYTVILNKDENVESVTGAGTYKYGETASINATLKEELGYDIRWNKWVSGDSTLVADNETQNTTIEMPAGDITLTATTTKEAKTDTAYKVEYYKEKLDGSYELAETEELTGTTGTKVIAKAKTPEEYKGFTEDTSNKDRVAEGVIAGDGSLTLRLYYTRNEYTVILNKDENVESVTGAGTYKYGESVSINATLKEELGYDIKWSKWISENKEIIGDKEEQNATIEMPAGDITLTATTTKEAKADTAYKVEHYKEKLDGSYELVETENLTGTTGTKVVAKAKTPEEYKGFTEDTSNKDRVPEGVIAGDGSLTLKLYYIRNQYTVILNKDENVESVTGAGTYKYGATASINATLKEEAGYDIKWNKWISSDSTLVADNETQNATIEMPAGDITLTATTTKEAKTDTVYKVEHYKEKLDGSYELAETENLTGTTGTKVVAKAKTPEEYKGFTEDKNNEQRVAEGVITGDGSLTLRLYYTRNQYTVILNKDENVESVTGAGTYKYGATVPINATLKEKAGYDIKWSKWISSDSTLVADNETQNAKIEMPAGDITLTATTTKEAKTDTAYKVEHYKEKLDGSYELAETEELTGTTGTKVIAKAKTPEEYKGFTEDTSNKDRVAEGVIAGDGSLTLKLYYTRNQYTVTLNKDENVESVTGAGTYKYGATVSINATLKEEAGYDIRWNKWVSGDSTLVADNETQNTTIEMPAGDITLTATTTKEAKTDTAYKVEHYKEELDGSYKLAETEELTGTTGTKVVAKAKTPEEYKGFTEDKNNEQRVAEGIIAGDGSLTLRLYYTRNQYTVTLNKDENVESVTGAGTYKYGATVSINATLKEEAGYDIRWNKWVSSDSTLVADNETQNATIEMPVGDITLTATTTKEAKADTAYKVEHYKEKLDGSYELAETENLTGTTGTKVVAKAKTSEEYKGFTEDTSNKDRVPEGTIAGDGSLTLKLYYTRNTYTIKFEDYNGSMLGEEKEYLYGQTIEVPENPTRPEDETYTYTFAGWDKEITEANENRVYVATYTATYREYVVTFKQDNGNEINSRNYHYGDTIIVPENPEKESTIEHAYEFIGWKLIKEGTAEDNIIEDTSNLTVTGNAEYIATYREEDIRYNFIYYNDDGEEVVARIDGYTFGNKLEIPTSATKESTDTIKYTFESWDMIGMEDISKTEKNVKFKAKYKEEYFVARLEETDTLEGKSYMTLQEAIDAADEEARTVKLLRDTEESVLVEDVQNITIDLNGKTVTGSKTGTKAYAVKNYGILEIIDTTEEKNGKIQESARGKTGYGIYNRDGQLTIRSGMIVTDTDVESGNTYAIYNQSEEPLIIAGGTTTAEARGISSSSYGIYNLSGKEIQVIGGTVLGNAGAESSKGYGIYNATDGNINVSGGRVKGSTSLASAVSYGIYNAVSENVTISGGVVEVKSDRGVAYGVYNEQGKVTQTGGTVDIVASTGYGFYNKKGTIEIKGGTIELNGSTMYGVYNETVGTANVLEGEINLLGTSACGIYNKGNVNVTGGNIVSKTENSGYGIYNTSVIDSNISNVTISKTDYGIYNAQGNLAVKNVNITARYGISMQANNYKVVLESANIVGKIYGINCTYGTVEIGIKDGKINSTQPNIYGETNAIYNDLMSTGKVKYYDGILTGNMVIYGGINEIEDNTQIVVSTNSNNKEVAKLETVVAEESVVKVGDTTYPTLAEAVDAVKKEANEQSLIEAISDFTISKAVEIPEGTNIKIDLSGHEVITYGKGGITNNGSLEIVDTSSAKNAEFISKIGIGITNKGTLVINGGSISSNVYGIYNYSSGNIVINDGVVTGKTNGMYNGKGQNAKITINGGTITGSGSISSSSNSLNSIIDVNDGTIIGNSDRGIYIDSGILNVSGGTITGNSNGVYTSYGTVNISGGIIKGIRNSGVYGENINMTAGKVVSDNGIGIYTTNGIIKIEGGEVNGSDGVSANIATIVIGKKDNNVNADNPTIIGKNYGISASKENGKIKIYDGKILGKTDAISGSINEIEDGKRIEIGKTTINEEEYKIANLVDNDIYENPIVRVGNNEYKTWKEIKEAISNIATNVTEATKITILNDFYMPEELEIKNGQKIILDLNGKTITTMSKIVNRGTLEIVDNTEDADGKILNTNSIGVQNFSNMTITKGTIEAKSYGIYNDSGDLTIGREDNNVTNMPMIKSELYGVYKNSGSIVMFDGIIFGKTSPDSMIGRTEEEYKVHSYQEGEYYKTVIVELSPMAKIGDIETSLREAIELAKKGDTIEILRNIEVKNETIVIPENKDITIDLKEYKISMKSSATNLNAILENRGTLNLIGKGSSGICNNTNIGTTIINNGTLKINTEIREEYANRPLVNNGTLDLLGGSIYSDYGTVVENNGIFNLKNGYIDCGGSYGSRYYMVRNTAEFNMLGGSIDTSWHKSGIKNEKGATFTMKAGTIYADECGIYNDSDNEINLLGGTIKRRYTVTSTSYAIYNNTNANIKIEGLTIYASYTYGIYNKLNGNITISNKTNINIMSSDYSYGIYNNGAGNIDVAGESIVYANNGKFAYGVYNNGSGNLSIEQSTISANGTNQAYGIMNANEGTVVITNGDMNIESNSGYAYGINNGVLGTVTIESGSIIVSTTKGKAYGINNESKNPLIIKEGVIGVGGTQSTGIYSSTSNIVLGNRDENITTEVPVIKADNIGVYINEVGAKFNFYDGQIIGKIPFNTGANTIDGYKIIQYYDKEETAEVAIPVETDYYVLTYAINGQEKYDSLVLKAGTKITNDTLPNIEEGYDFSGWEGLPEVMPSEDVTVYAILVPKTYTITYYVDGEEYARQENIEYKSTITPIEVPQKEGNEFSGWEGLPEVMPAEDIEVRGLFTYFATFYNEDKTEVIKQVPFTINDTSIEEPKIVEQEGYIRYWDEYKLEAKNIEIPLISIEKSTVVNKTQRKSYNNIESAIAEAKTDGTKDELYLFEDINSETTLIIPENTNIEINLNGHKIINNNTYCAINNYGTLTIKNTSEELSSIEISKEGTNVYGIYNRKNVTVDNVNIKVTSEETYEGIGIYNEANTITTLGIKDEIASKTMPKIVATTFAISNESGIFNFYDGYLIADRAINGKITETEIGHDKNIEIIDEKENCYLEQIANGTKLQAIDENGITWNFTVSNKRAINVYYESGDLPENLVIPSTLKGCPVTSLHNTNRNRINIFEKSDNTSNSKLKKVTIPDSVTIIGSYAFYGCTSLTNVIIPDSVTIIGDDAFYRCTSLTSIVIPDSVTSIASYAFYGCTSLTNIVIPDSITRIGRYAFYGCTSLTNIVIPDSVTSIETYAFYNCTSLANVTIGNSVTSIGSDAFYGCTLLTSIIIPDSVTRVESYAFYRCTSLTSVTIPDSVTSIGSHAFYGCTSLINITIGRGVTSTLDDIFDSYNKLERIDVSEENTKYSSMQGILFNKEKSTIIKYPSNKNDISNYEIPSTVEIIEKYAFQNCTSLTSVTIPDSVTSISGSAFIGCNKLERIDVSENNDTYSSVDGILYNKEKTEMLIVPEGNKSIGIIETPHLYSNNMSETYSKIIEGASSLSLVFDSKCELESGCDYIEIYNKTDTLVYTSKGRGNRSLANKEITVEGDTVKIYFHTDSSVVYWGFKCLVKASNTK